MGQEASAGRLFGKYVSQNILGMLGISAYILADTFFIAKAQGANGIAALNLVLPLYSIIFAIGSMIGVGSATRFSIYRARGEEVADRFFFNACFFAFLFSIVFIAGGIFMPDRIVAFLGGDETIVAVGTSYTRIFMVFAPLFMLNYICNAFVRNDGNPSLAMLATLCSSLFNIVMDYILMFPLHMGMSGAALATAFSPAVGVSICCVHFFSKKNTVRCVPALPSLSKLLESCQLGVGAFVGEMASGVTTMIFNILILGLTGNVGVAAYGVVANTALVATSTFNGIAQGTQPLLSDYYGKGDQVSLKKIKRLSFITAVCCASVLFIIINMLSNQVVNLFNNEQNIQMAQLADRGLKLYFIGFLFAGCNIVGIGYLSATETAGWAFLISIMRGFVAISVCAFSMAALFGMNGVWLAFPAAEFVTMLILVYAMWFQKGITKKRKKMRNHSLCILICLVLGMTGCAANGTSGQTSDQENTADLQTQDAGNQNTENISEEAVTTAFEETLAEAVISGTTDGNANNYSILATDGTYLYGTNYADGGFLSRFDLETNTYQNLIEAPVNQINMNQDTIICAKNYDSADGTIVSIKTDGSEEQVIFEACPTYMRVAGDWIYYCDAATHHLEKVKTDGTGHEVLSEQSCYYIAVNGDSLVFQMDSDGEALYSIGMDGSNLQKLTQTPAWYPICEQGRIYYKSCTEAGTYVLQSMDTSGKDVQTLAEQAVFSMNLSADAQKLVFSDANDGKLYEITLDGNDLTEVSDYERLYKAEDGTYLAARKAKQICTVGPYTSLFFTLENGGQEVGEGARIENSNHVEPVPDSYEGFQN